MLQEPRRTAPFRTRPSAAEAATRVLVAHVEDGARRSIAATLRGSGCDVVEVGEARAVLDELTGVPNRRYVLRQLDALLSRARRHDRALSVLMVDADHFRALNDRHGHQAGDVALRAIAARLRERVRREDLMGRVGGEELVVGLPDTGIDGAVALAEDVRAAVAAQPIATGRLAVPLTVSIGCAGWEGERLERLVARADAALYAAKAAGRDRVAAAPAGERVSRSPRSSSSG